MKKVFELNFRGRKLVVEHGELAKQAHGSVLVRYGDTVILSTTVVSKTANISSKVVKLGWPEIFTLVDQIGPTFLIISPIKLSLGTLTATVLPLSSSLKIAVKGAG